MDEAWRTAYQVSILTIATEFALMTTLFLMLRPRTRMEWATLIATASFAALFGTLAYWHLHPDPGVRPNVFPPLVVAFWCSVVAMGWFTSCAWRDWLSRR